MTDNGELHVIFGTGAVRISVMDELIRRGRRRVRMVNRSGRARVPHGVEVVGGDATDEAFARGASEGASVVYFALVAASALRFVQSTVVSPQSGRSLCPNPMM